jgi:hypothetical protein
VVIPRKSYVDTASEELNQMTRFVEESAFVIELSHVDSDDSREIAGPFGPAEVKIVTSGHNVNPIKVRFVNPFLILKDVIC